MKTLEQWIKSIHEFRMLGTYTPCSLLSPTYRKGMVVTTMPRSGSVSVAKALMAATGLELLHGAAPGLLAETVLPTQFMERYLAGGFYVGGHIQPTPYNKRVLHTYCGGKVAVQVRDPRPAFVSFIGQMAQSLNSNPMERRRHIGAYGLSPDFMKMSRDQQAVAMVEAGYYQFILDYLRGWSEYQGDILITHYADYKNDNADVLQRILEFYDRGECGLLMLERVDGKDHYNANTPPWYETIGENVADLLTEKLTPKDMAYIGGNEHV